MMEKINTQKKSANQRRNNDIVKRACNELGRHYEILKGNANYHWSVLCKLFTISFPGIFDENGIPSLSSFDFKKISNNGALLKSNYSKSFIFIENGKLFMRYYQNLFKVKQVDLLERISGKKLDLNKISETIYRAKGFRENNHLTISRKVNVVCNSSLQNFKSSGYSIEFNSFSITEEDFDCKSELEPETIESIYSESLYSFEGRTARAMRVIGSSSVFFTPEKTHVGAHPERVYKLPRDIDVKKKNFIDFLEKDSIGKYPFFNGPHTRLISCHEFTVDPVTEETALRVDYGPLDWYDYAAVDAHIRGIHRQGKCVFEGVMKKRHVDEISQYIDLEEVSRQRISNSKLTNIVGCAITFLTKDGYLLYQARGDNVQAAQSLLTSCVAENIQRKKDFSMKPRACFDFPPPFNTTLRGIKEEISPKIFNIINENRSSIYLLGVAFDLVFLHPNFLMLVVLPVNYEEFNKNVLDFPGKHWFEGKTRRVHYCDKVAIDLIFSKDWVPSGKASMIRALEFIEVLMEEHSLDLKNLADMLFQGELGGAINL